MLSEEENIEIWLWYFSYIGCNSMGKIIFTLLMGLIFFILSICVLIMLSTFTKKQGSMVKKNRSSTVLYKMAIVYMLWTVLFYLTIITQSLNHCFWNPSTIAMNGYIQWVTYVLFYAGYAIGYQIFLSMLFFRLYTVFKVNFLSLYRSTQHIPSQIP